MVKKLFRESSPIRKIIHDPNRSFQHPEASARRDKTNRRDIFALLSCIDGHCECVRSPNNKESLLIFRFSFLPMTHPVGFPPRPPARTRASWFPSRPARRGQLAPAQPRKLRSGIYRVLFFTSTFRVIRHHHRETTEKKFSLAKALRYSLFWTHRRHRD